MQWQLGPNPGVDHLELVDASQLTPAAGEVLVAVRAASMNYRDTIVIEAADRFTPGRVPLSDGAGEVIAVGAGVSRWQVGDHVIGTFFRDWVSGRFDMRYHQAALGGSVDGVLRRTAIFPEHALVRMPRHYDFRQASTLPCAGLTAWYALMHRCRYQPGETVLLLGTGGVAIWGLQIVAASGGRAVITSSSDVKLARARELGAAETINYRSTPAWEKEVFRVTAGRGVDHVLELGGPGTLGKSLASVAAGGQIAQIGVLTGFSPPDASLFPLLSKNATLHGVYVGHREALEQLVVFLEQTKIAPIIDRVFDFEDAPAAYRYLRSGEHLGKVVITVS